MRGSLSMDTANSSYFTVILLIEATPWVREALAHALEIKGNGICVVRVGDAPSAGESDTGGRAAVLLLSNVGLPSGDLSKLETVKAAISHRSDLPIAVLSDVEEPEHVALVMGKGVRGYIPTSLSLECIIQALLFIAAGGIYVPAHIFLDHCCHNIGVCDNSPADENSLSMVPLPGCFAVEPGSGLNEMTAREKTVLECMAQGKSNKHIARELDMMESTVKVHIRHIMRKLHLKNRTQVALLVNKMSKVPHNLPGTLAYIGTTFLAFS